MNITPTDRRIAEAFAGPEPFELAPSLIAFVVQVKCAKQVLQQFEAMGTSSMAVAAQHEGLCDPEQGQYLNVRRLVSEADREDRKQHRALEMQIERPSELTIACMGGDRS